MGFVDLWRRVLVISGLSALAVTGPLLDVYGKNPEVFVANRTTPLQMILFALVVAAFVPVLASLIVWSFTAVSPRAGDIAYGVVVTGLAVAIGLVVGRQMTDSMLFAVLIVVAVVELFVVVNRWAEGFLVMASVALPVVLGLFLVTSPASALIWEREAVEESGEVGVLAPILFIQLDEFPLASIMGPDGGINRDLFPNFARLADEGTWYRNALADSIATAQSIPAILTGRRGERGLSPSSVDHPENLFTLLAADYEMQVIEWVAAMCPTEVCPDFAGRAPARFGSLLADVGVVYLHLAVPVPAEESLPGIDNSWTGFLGQGEPTEGVEVSIDGLPVPGPDVRADWVDWLQRIANGVGRTDRPVLSYAHVPSPHVPWVTNPSGSHYQRPEQYTEVEGVGGDGRWADERLAMIGYQRHLYQLGLLDRMLGRIFAEMDRAGIWKGSMVVVVADHGASFVVGEHRRWPHESNRDDLYRVPMFVKYPGQTVGSVVDEPAFGIDLLPSIVDALAVRTDWEFDGISLLDIEGTDRPHQPIWWCCSRLPASTDLDVLLAQVGRNHSWIPDQTSWLGVAGVGPNAELIGARVDALPVEMGDRVLWHVELGADLVETDRTDGITQTYISGRVAFPSDIEPDEVLLVMNGTVAGMAVIIRDGPEGGTFHGMVAEDIVSTGPNQLDLLVPGPGGVWLAGVDDDLSLELITGDGRVLDVRPEGARRLQVDSIELGDGVWTMVGWAADVTAKVPPERIHVFAADVLLASVPPNRDNRNVVAWFGSEDLIRSGFSVEIAAGAVPDGTAQLTVVAEFDTYAVGEAVRLGSD
jgi:hypothetical protein